MQSEGGAVSDSIPTASQAFNRKPTMTHPAMREPS
jgi:hypothetical protein